MLRASLDVNVLVSSVIGPFGPSRQILTAWATNRFTLLTSEHIIMQATAKLRTRRIGQRYNITPTTIQTLETLLRAEAIVVPILPGDIHPVTGDAEDDTVLATARLGSADYLVTGDAGLLALSPYDGIRIVTPRAFWELLTDSHAFGGRM
jgi:putative PIN family toxin of toxin-antitoxin system